MKRETYMLDGRVVLGYRIGEYLAIRDGCASVTTDRRTLEENGKWLLEHLPTGLIIARGYRRDGLIKLAKSRPSVYFVAGIFSDFWLNTKDLSELVREIKTRDPAWYEAIETQRASVGKRTIEGYEISGPITRLSPSIFVARYTGPGRPWLRFVKRIGRLGHAVSAFQRKRDAEAGFEL